MLRIGLQKFKGPSYLRFSSIRCSSTTTAPSLSSVPSHPLPPILPPTATRTLLYTAPPLPPLPPPLPHDASPSYVFSAPTSTTRNATTPIEQLAVLNACLVSGDITRAEEVARRIRTGWERAGRAGRKGLCEVLPSRIHADFLRFYFVEGGKGGVSKAWAYFDGLLEREWEEPGPGILRKNGVVDPAVLAVMFKAITAAGPTIYNPSEPDGYYRPITSLLPILAKLGVGLSEVIGDVIFDITLASYLGTVSREQVLAAIAETGQGRNGWGEWESEVARVLEKVKREAEGRVEVAREVVGELDPTLSVSRFLNSL